MNGGKRIIGIGNNAAKDIKDSKTTMTDPPTSSMINSILIANRTPHADMQEITDTIIIGSLSPSNSTIGPDTHVLYYRNGGEISVNSNVEATGVIYANSYIATSDKNLKNVISKYTKGLSEITKIKPVEFVYKDDKNKTQRIGVIAQDLQKIFPQSVTKNSDSGYLSVNTDATFYALLNSIKELDSKNKILEENNKELERKIVELKKIRDNIRAKKGGLNE